MPKIRFCGKIGIVRVYDKKIKAKLDDRGIHCMFIGYSKDHILKNYLVDTVYNLTTTNTF